MGVMDYGELTQQISGYSQQIRFEGAYSRGDSDMDVSFLETRESFSAHHTPQEVTLDALCWKGKG